MTHGVAHRLDEVLVGAFTQCVDAALAARNQSMLVSELRHDQSGGTVGPAVNQGTGVVANEPFHLAA